MSINPSKRSAPQAFPEAKRPRSHFKCEYCRENKKACNPVQRDWDTQREKCENCLRNNLPCGPNKRHNEGHVPAGNTGGGSTGQGGLSAMAGRSSSPPFAPSVSQPPLFQQVAPSSTVIPNTHTANPNTNLPPLLPRPPHPTPSTPQGNFHHTLGSADSSSTNVSLNVSTNSSFHPTCTSCSTPDSATSTGVYRKIQEELSKGQHELDKNFDLVNNVSNRSQTAGSALPLKRTPIAETYLDLTLALDVPFKQTCESFADTLRQQLTLVLLIPDHLQEVELRRLLEFARPLCTRPRAKVKRLGTESCAIPLKLIKVYGSILLALVRVCDEAGNARAADRFLVELASLPSVVNALKTSSALMQRLEQAFQKQSITLNTIWYESGLHVFPDLFPDSTPNLFCYEHLIMLSEMSTAIIQSVLKYEADKGRHDRLGRKDMHIAVEAAKPDLVRLVFERDAQSLEDVDIFRMTPILLASLVGDFQVFKLLYEYKAKTSALDRFNRDVLVIACEMGHDSIVNFLLEHDFSVDNAYHDPQYSPLFAAAGRGRQSIVTTLLLKGANPLQVSFGQTPREVAELNGYHDISKILETAEAKVKTATESHSLSDRPFIAGKPMWARTAPHSSRSSSIQGATCSPLLSAHVPNARWLGVAPGATVHRSPNMAKSPLASCTTDLDDRASQSPAVSVRTTGHNMATTPMPAMDSMEDPSEFDLSPHQSHELPSIVHDRIATSPEPFLGPDISFWTDFDVPEVSVNEDNAELGLV